MSKNSLEVQKQNTSTFLPINLLQVSLSSPSRSMESPRGTVCRTSLWDSKYFKILQSALRRVGRDHNQRVLVSDPLRGELQHSSAQLGARNYFHTCLVPLTRICPRQCTFPRASFHSQESPCQGPTVNQLLCEGDLHVLVNRRRKSNKFKPEFKIMFLNEYQDLINKFKFRTSSQ